MNSSRLREAVDDDVQPGQAAKADQERLHELPQQIAIDDQQTAADCRRWSGAWCDARHACSLLRARLAPRSRRNGAMARARASMPRRMFSALCTPKLKPNRFLRRGFAFGRITVLARHVQHAFVQRVLRSACRPGPASMPSGSSQPDVQPAGRAAASCTPGMSARNSSMAASMAASFVAIAGSQQLARAARTVPARSTVGHQVLIEIGRAEIDVAPSGRRPARPVPAAGCPSPRGCRAKTIWKTSRPRSPCRPRRRSCAGSAGRRPSSAARDRPRRRSRRSCRWRDQRLAISTICAPCARDSVTVLGLSNSW